jgi:hypothetical protein
VATCGSYLLGEEIKNALHEVETLDDLIDGMREFVADVDNDRMTFAIAGFRSGAPEIWLGSTISSLPFQRRDDVHLGQPPISGDDLARGLGPISGPNEVSVEVLAETIITLQRECVVWPGFAEPVHLVGGECQLGVVRPDGASVRTLLTWQEDKIGEKIRPAAVDWNGWRRTHAVQADPAPAAMPGSSRQQRRAAARKAA